MRYQVPQFIEIEDKIFGPLTLKQFIYLAGGGGLSFVMYVLLDSLTLAIVPIILIMGLSSAFAFYKLNNKSFVEIMEAAFKFYLGGKLYIWRKENRPKPQTTTAALKDAKNYASIMVPKVSDSRLKDLTWSLDIKESIYSNNKQK
ncbi:MAG: PrgI family protein [bacterium]|nr:PrgI family protein [bacterium]